MNEVCSKEYAKTNYQGVNSRCYVWSDDVNKNKTVLDSLDLDYDKLLSANTKYIFSSYKIQNLRLISEKVFKSEFEDMSIFTYSIN